MRNRTLNLAGGCRAHSASDHAVLRETGIFSKLVVNEPSRDTLNQTSSEPAGSLEVALERAAQLLDVEPLLAAEQAQEILDAIPNHPPAMFLLAMAKRRSGDPQAALELLEPPLNTQHKWAAAYFEYGASLGDVGRGDEAIQALLKAVQYQPEHPEAWRILADHLMATGDTEGSDVAYARHVQCSTRDPLLQAAAAAMIKYDIAIAERILKKHLKEKPTDVSAIRMLAEYPENARVWLSYGHVLQTEGRQEDSVQAYRKNIERDPHLGEAYWTNRGWPLLFVASICAKSSMSFN